MLAKLSADGQITLPQEVREHLHLSPGDEVKIFVDRDGRAVILPTLPISSLKGILKGRLNRILTVEEMEEGIAAGAVEDYNRSLEG